MQKTHIEKRHIPEPHESLRGPTMDNPRLCMRPFPDSYKVSVKEYTQEKTMTQKVRVKTMEEQRNGCGMASLGDKNYKNPDYVPGFFKEGGLIAGST